MRAPTALEGTHVESSSIESIEAMEHLVSRFLGPIRSTVRKAVSNDHLAEDLTQEAFLRIQRALPSFDPSRALRPWVFTIVANLLRDHWRSSRRRRVEALGADHETGLEGPNLEGPEGVVEQGELAARIRRAIDRVPPGMRRVLEMRFFGELSFEDIAEELGTSVVTARKRHSRGLHVLRLHLRKDAPVGACA